MLNLTPLARYDLKDIKGLSETIVGDNVAKSPYKQHLFFFVPLAFKPAAAFRVFLQLFFFRATAAVLKPSWAI